MDRFIVTIEYQNGKWFQGMVSANTVNVAYQVAVTHYAMENATAIHIVKENSK
jgi:hypothetical protein